MGGEEKGHHTSRLLSEPLFGAQSWRARHAPHAAHLSLVVVEQAVAVGEDEVELVRVLGDLKVHTVKVDA